MKILRKTTRGESSVFQVGSLVCPPAPPQLKEKFKGVPPAVELAARVAFFCFTKITLKPTWLHPKDTGIDGCLGGAHFFRSWIRFAFFFFIVWGAPTRFTFPFMVDGVFFWNAFFFLEVILFSGIPQAEEQNSSTFCKIAQALDNTKSADFYKRVGFAMFFGLGCAPGVLCVCFNRG